MNRYAGIMVERSDGRVLTLKHRKRGWTIPGGKVDLHETPREAVRRELQEETGLHRQIITCVGEVAVDYDGVTWYGTIFHCKLWRGQDQPKVMEPDKFEGLDWKTLAEFERVAPKMCPEIELFKKHYHL